MANFQNVNLSNIDADQPFGHFCSSFCANFSMFPGPFKQTLGLE